MLLVTLTVKKVLERFTKNNCQNQIKKGLELKKYSREMAINYMLNQEAAIILLPIS